MPRFKIEVLGKCRPGSVAESRFADLEPAGAQGIINGDSSSKSSFASKMIDHHFLDMVIAGVQTRSSAV